MNVHLKGIAVVPENAFLISTGNIHNKLIGMNAVHFAAEVNDSETLDLLISQGIPTGLSSRTPTQEDVALNNSTFVQKQEEEVRFENVFSKLASHCVTIDSNCCQS